MFKAQRRNFSQIAQQFWQASV